MTQKNNSSVLDYEKVLPILGKVSIFGGLNDTQIHQLLKSLQRVEYKAGDTIFKKGEGPSHIYVIKKGRIEILLGHDKPMETPIIFEVGDCFGESSVIGIQPHTATAVAIEDCTLIMLSRNALMKFFNHDKELFGLLILNIARETSRRLHRANEALLYSMADQQSDQ